MLSILIPVYNVVCTRLVRKLHEMALQTNVPFEILLGDDASCKEVRDENRTLNTLKECRMLEFDKNRGPALVRNNLGEQASYPNLLFLDTDVMPVSDDFLLRYIENIDRQVVCGGFLYHDNADCYLRYKYGIEVESQPVAVRQKSPNKQFISMNFFIQRDLFLSVRFDEAFHIGYEDTAFGKRLNDTDVTVTHIDNPVWHEVNEEATAFLGKIRCAVENLLGYEDELLQYVKLLRWYKALKRIHATRLTALLFRLSEKLITKNLTGKHPSLKLFAFYKLGYLCKISE